MSPKTVCRDMYLGARRILLKLAGVAAKRPDISAEDVKSILAVRIDRIGDLIVSLPALRALKDIFPNAKITVLTAEGNAALLNACPWIDEAMPYKGFIGTAGLLRKKCFDLAIDLLMDYPVRPALLVYMSNSKFTVGFDIAGKGSLFNLRIAPGEEKKHVSYYMLDLARAIARSYMGKNYDLKIPGPVLSVSGGDIDEAVRLLEKKGAAEKDLKIVIHPGGHYESQRWPVENFAALADITVQKFKVKVIIIGSADEEALIDRMMDMMKEPAVKAPGLPLDKLAGLISKACMFTGNNSGPWHIACALGIPTVSTMGPTDPVLWWPIGDNHIVVRKDMPCSPCDRPVCARHDCMKAISVEDMAKAVEDQMGRMEKR